jgi:hypothetical protein
MLDTHCFSPLFWTDRTNQKGLKLSGARQLLVHDNGVDISRGDVYTTKNTEVLLFSSKTVCIEGDAEKFNFISYLCLVVRMQDKIAT